MNTSRKIFPLVQQCVRQYSQASGSKSLEIVEEVPSKTFKKLKETQKIFGVDDGVPVFLKKGFSDRILYILTSVGVLVGFGLSCQTFYKITVK